MALLNPTTELSGLGGKETDLDTLESTPVLLRHA